MIRPHILRALSRSVAAAALALAGGCDILDDNPFGGSSPRNTWELVDGPCVGAETATLWFDDAKRGYIGCGDAAEAHGLFVTSNGGRSWTLDPAFQLFRIHAVTRGGPQQRLFAAGANPRAGGSAWRILEGAFVVPEPLFATTGDAVAHAGAMAVAADGFVVVAALDGLRAAAGFDGEAFEQLPNLAASDATPLTVKRIAALGARFAGIASDGTLLLPSRRTGAPRTELAPFIADIGAGDAEWLDLHVFSDTSLLLVGRDRTTNTPRIARCDGEPQQASSWTVVDTSVVAAGANGALHGIAVRGQRVVVVGARSPQSAGAFIFSSNDQGISFTAITPADVAPGPLTRAALLPDGTLVAAGSGLPGSGANRVLLSPVGAFE